MPLHQYESHLAPLDAMVESYLLNFGDAHIPLPKRYLFSSARPAVGERVMDAP